MKEIYKDLTELTKHLNLPLWQITVLVWVCAIGLVILMALVDSN